MMRIEANNFFTFYNTVCSNVDCTRILHRAKHQTREGKLHVNKFNLLKYDIMFNY